MTALLAVGCGAEEPEQGAPAGSTDGQTHSAPPSTTELTLTFWSEGPDGPAQEATLTCEPPGGTHPDPERACSVLFSNADALVPPGADVACTQIYGGPEEARLAGLFRGEQIEVALNRTNGCEINRWERLLAVVALKGV